MEHQHGSCSTYRKFLLSKFPKCGVLSARTKVRNVRFVRQEIYMFELRTHKNKNGANGDENVRHPVHLYFFDVNFTKCLIFIRHFLSESIY